MFLAARLMLAGHEAVKAVEAVQAFTDPGPDVFTSAGYLLALTEDDRAVSAHRRPELAPEPADGQGRCRPDGRLVH